MNVEAPVLNGPRGLVRITRTPIAAIGVIAFASEAAAVVTDAVALITGPFGGRRTCTLVGGRAIPPGADHGTTRIVDGSRDSATVVLTGVRGAPAVLSLIALVAAILTRTILCAVVVLSGWRLMRRRLLRPSLSVDVALLGSVVAVGATVEQGADSLASGTVAAALNDRALEGYWPVAGRFDPTWLIVGLVLALVGPAFEYGKRLQRDTDGLV